TASSVDQAKAIRADIESQKALLGTALFTELKNKAVKRYYQVNAQNKVEAVINSIPNPGEPEAAEMFAKAAQKALLGTALFTELKNKAVKRYYQVNAQNKVEAVINSIPNPGEPEAAEMFAKAERQSPLGRRACDVALAAHHEKFGDYMKPEYIG
ncbi:DUF4060 family protein, partial [Salmonella enterica]|uniref:DUF4060 family protein n=1 Tax=Salmonella enterica TaxID=28901 RepID=UPI003F68B1E2